MKKVYITLLLFICFLIYTLISIPYYSGDVKNHLVWSKSIIGEGPLGFYERYFHDYSFPNYPPVAMWSFVATELLYRNSVDLIWFLNTNLSFFPSNLVHFFQWENVEIAYLKLPAIIANFFIAASIYLLAKSLKKSLKTRLLSAGLFLFNPAAVYISAVWGQIDTVPIAFFLFAILLLQKKRPILASVVLTLGLLSKQTIVVFVPLLAILLLKKSGFKTAVYAGFISIAVFYIAYLPFHQFSLTWPVKLYRSNFDFVAYATSPSGVNFWGALSDFKSVSDLDKFLILTYQQWGHALFSIFFIPTLFVMFFKKIGHEKIYMFLFLTTILYFFFLTRMHERYLIPSVVFGSILLIFKRKYLWGLIFFTFLHLFNLYKGLLQPDFYLFNEFMHSINIQKFFVCIYFLFIAGSYIWFFRIKEDPGD